METAFRATFISTSSTPNIAFISEYDALPSIGHACGHNLIAEVGVAAGLGLMAALQSSNDIKGKVKLSI
jgi:metal-dependent amidase/aminoacylase/carboxypeptidase family protein